MAGGRKRTDGKRNSQIQIKGAHKPFKQTLEEAEQGQDYYGPDARCVHVRTTCMRMRARATGWPAATTGVLIRGMRRSNRRPICNASQRLEVSSHGFQFSFLLKYQPTEVTKFRFTQNV